MPSESFVALMSGPPARAHSDGGWFSSRKFGHIEYRSQLELDFIRFCESEPRITFLRDRPCTLIYPDERGLPRGHAPAFGTVRAGTGTIIETMPSKDVKKFEGRTRALARQLASRGIAYDVMTEFDIQFEPRLGNARELLRGLGTEPDPAFVDAVVKLLAALPGGAVIGSIPEVLGVARDARYAVYRMILDGTIRLDDPDTPLTVASRVVVGDSP